MDISSLQSIQTSYLNEMNNRSFLSDVTEKDGKDFGSIFDSMVNALNETNDLHNAAEEEEIRFALGESENTHDLLIAQTKATVALQYTVAVRDKLIESYREIMQMQI